MKTSQDYDTICQELINAGLGDYIDMCVDSENCYPLTELDSLYWDTMIMSLVDSVGSRASEDGIDINTLGFRY